MPTGNGLLRSRTRDLFARAFRKKGYIPLSTYLTYNIGDFVDVKVNGAIHKGMPHKFYHGSTGRVWNVTKRAIGDEINKQYDQQSVTKLFRGTIFQKHHHFCTTTASSSDEGIEEKEKISVTFVDKDGEEQHIKVPIGMSMLEAAHENDIELEGACEGSLACSTCHVVVMDMEYYNKLEDPTDEENDMLDLAFGLTETSRLGCQVIASPELDGVRLAIPAATRNFAVDGYVPKPH